MTTLKAITKTSTSLKNSYKSLFLGKSNQKHNIRSILNHFIESFIASSSEAKIEMLFYLRLDFSQILHYIINNLQ